jgi:hypothetical protein
LEVGGWRLEVGRGRGRGRREGKKEVVG